MKELYHTCELGRAKHLIIHVHREDISVEKGRYLDTFPAYPCSTCVPGGYPDIFRARVTSAKCAINEFIAVVFFWSYD